MNVMLRAWELSQEGLKKFGGEKIEYFRESLKIAWSETKEAKTLKEMSKDELIALLIAVQKELEERELIEKKEYIFNFQCQFDSKKTTAYVAKLFWNETEKKIDREFKDIERTYSKMQVIIDDTYKAEELEVLEIQEGGSHKNKYRKYYVVENGKLSELGDTEKIKNKATIKKYLRKKISLEELKKEMV